MRTGQDVAFDLEAVLKGVGDSAPECQLVMSLDDFALLRGLGGQPGIVLYRDYPALTKALKMNVRLDPNYNGPPRITGVLGKEDFDAHAEKERRDAALKRFRWRDADLRLRQGIDGRPLL